MKSNNSRQTGITQLRAEEVAEKLGISLSTFRRFITLKGNDFPQPIRYNSRWVAWFECEVESWIIRKAAEQRGQEPEELAQHLNNEIDFVSGQPEERIGLTGTA